MCRLSPYPLLLSNSSFVQLNRYRLCNYRHIIPLFLYITPSFAKYLLLKIWFMGIPENIGTFLWQRRKTSNFLLTLHVWTIYCVFTTPPTQPLDIRSFMDSTVNYLLASKSPIVCTYVSLDLACILYFWTESNFLSTWYYPSDRNDLSSIWICRYHAICWWHNRCRGTVLQTAGGI